ncbi:hypothetical protein CF319_g8662 [Tilletia indica]|nr:hypothetical protein CF319_g8662 [Tilletia indica]
MSSRKQPTDTPSREEFSALDSARAKLDDDVALVRRSVDSNSSDIKDLKTGIRDVKFEVASLHSKFDQLLASITPLPPPPSTTPSTAPSVVSSVTTEAPAPTQPTEPPRWDSQAAAYPDGKTPAASSGNGKEIRFNTAPSAVADDPSRSFNIKPDELGYFEGVPEDSALFLANIEAIRATERDPGWDKAILRTLPRTLRGPARLWFASLTAAERSTHLASLDALIAAVKANFKPPQPVIRHQARTRRWRPDEEDAVHYTFVKAALLKIGWPSLTEGDLVHEVTECIDPAVAKLLQTPFRKDPTLTALRTELRVQETYWRTEFGRPLVRSAPTTSSVVGVPAYNSLLQDQPAPTGSAFPAQTGPIEVATDAFPQTSKFAAAERQTPNLRQGRSIRSDFTPTNLSYRIHPESHKRMMSYKVPLTNRIMWCVRPCDQCGGEHFGFAHDYCSKNTVPTVLTIDSDEDYPCTVDEGF